MYIPDCSASRQAEPAPTCFRRSAGPTGTCLRRTEHDPSRHKSERLGSSVSNPTARTAGTSPFRGGQTVKKPPESSRGPQPSRTSNRAQRRVRWARDGFCKSHFPEQKSFPCSFCARKSLRFQQKLVRVAERLKTLWVFRFRLWRNCRRLKS